MEVKTSPIEACEFKFDDDAWKITGYASVFNSVDKVGDTILPGAFTKSIESGDEIKMYYEHLRFLKPGKWESFEEDEKGLRVVGYLTRDHSLAKDIRAEMRHGTVKSFSIGFTIPPGGYEETEDGGRILKTIDLVETSLTGNPAEPKAIIESFKSELDTVQTLRDMEKFLRESGNYSKSMATALLGRAKAICRSESEQETALKMREMRAVIQLKGVFDKYDLRKLLNP